MKNFNSIIVKITYKKYKDDSKKFNIFRNLLPSNWCPLVVEMRTIFKQQVKVKKSHYRPGQA